MHSREIKFKNIANIRESLGLFVETTRFYQQSDTLLRINIDIIHKTNKLITFNKVLLC